MRNFFFFLMQTIHNLLNLINHIVCVVPVVPSLLVSFAQSFSLDCERDCHPLHVLSFLYITGVWHTCMHFLLWPYITHPFSLSPSFFLRVWVTCGPVLALTPFNVLRYPRSLSACGSNNRVQPTLNTCSLAAPQTPWPARWTARRSLELFSSHMTVDGVSGHERPANTSWLAPDMCSTRALSESAVLDGFANERVVLDYTALRSV